MTVRTIGSRIAVAAGALAAVTTLAAAPAAAQGRPPQPQGLSVTVGVAPIVAPVYDGADEYAFSIFPDIRVAYGARFFGSVPEGFGYRVVNTRRWRAGPIARLRFGRDEDSGGSPFLIAGESDDLQGLGNVGVAVELGAFGELSSGPWVWRGEMRQGVGAHDGLVGDVRLSRIQQFGKTTVIAGPSVSFGGGDFVNVYYGVDATQSAASGLRAFEGDGGLVSWGVGVTAVRPISERVTATFLAGYDRISGDAADSPIVADVGSRNQARVGFAFGYRF
ncbi:MAG: MipA/OmpV family protein [Pseudomonadota bacterium]